MKKKEITPVAPSFEEGMKALEEIVGRLESGEIPLEEALKAYEDGVGIVRKLNDALSVAEKRIEVLTRGADGRLRIEEVDEEEL